MYNLILKQNTRDKQRMPEMFLFKYRKGRFSVSSLLSCNVTFNLTGGLCHVMCVNLFDVETFLKMDLTKPFCLFPCLSTKGLKCSQNIITIKKLYFMMFF